MWCIKKVIFLDFDGVLNTEHNQNMLRYHGEAWQDEHGALFDSKAVAELKRIVDNTGAEIVIESSWKYLGLEAMQQMWAERNMPGAVIGITPSSASDSWLLSANPDDFDPANGRWKGVEIEAWIADNLYEDARFVIIDDEYVILDSQQPHFVQTDSYDGITPELADKAIEILNR